MIKKKGKKGRDLKATVVLQTECAPRMKDGLIGAE